MSTRNQFVLTLSCRDTKGIVHAVSGLLFQAGCNIIDSQQFGDVLASDATGLFFLRVHFEAPPHLADVATLDPLFTHLRGQFGMDAKLYSLARKPRVLMMVSKHGHCLNDLLFRWRSGQLNVDIPAIVSNHPDYADLAASYGINFHHLPLATGSGAEAKRAQERCQQSAQYAENTLVAIGSLGQAEGESLEEPDYDGHHENQGSGPDDKITDLVPDMQEQGFGVRQAIGRQLDDERRLVAAQDRAVQQER